jgi:HD superfamily phosphohydrolase
MYWQVYLHKTVLSAENLLVNILKRAKELAEKKEVLFCTPALKTFLYKQHSWQDFISNPKTLETFALLDDTDIMTSVKVWTTHKDAVLSMLCRQLIDRKLFKIELQNLPFKEEKIKELKDKTKSLYKLNDKQVNYFVFSGDVANDAYRADKISINILFKDGSVADIAKASDQLNIQVLAKTVKKYYLCYPK